jgi:uncharacterized protein (TIGR02996 family)
MARKKLTPLSSRDSERAGLFAAVKQAPDDDAPRLVLADWLEEHGDEHDRAHAELIRAQCEIQRLTAEIVAPDNPEPLRLLLCSAGYNTSLVPYHFSAVVEADVRIRELLSRQEQLLKVFRGERGRIRGLSFAHIHEFNRGFVELGLNYAPFRPRELTAYAASPAGPRVESLTVTIVPSNVGTVGRNALLGHASGLTVCSFRADNKSVASLLASPRLAGLRRLDLGRMLGAEKALPALAACPQRDQLTHLYLYGSNISPARARTLAAIELPSLEVLNLAGNVELGPKGVAELAAAPFLGQLRELDLSNCHIGPEGVEPLVSSPNFRCPNQLELDSNAISGAGLRALLKAPGLERVIVLRLESTRLNADDIAELAACPRLAGLLHLCLSPGSALGPAGAQALAGSRHLRSLASLELSGCPIGEQGARALARSTTLRKLQLEIDQEGVSDDTLAALKERYFLKDV